MKASPISIGIVGCGAISQLAHIPAALRARNVLLLGLCDQDPSLLNCVADKAGVENRYAKYSDMLADERIAAVVLAVPDQYHVPLATKAILAGKHVLVEKPLGSSSAECRQLCELVASRNAKLQVGCMKRHDAGVRAAKKHVQDVVGQILNFSGVYQDSIFRNEMQQTCFDPIIKSSTVHDASWKSDRRHYNFTTQGAHIFDMLHYLAGPFIEVYAQEAEVNENYSWHGVLRSATGSVGHFELTCKITGDWRERYTVAGVGGNVEIQPGLWFFHRPAVVSAFDGAKRRSIQSFSGNTHLFANQLDAFALSILDDLPTCPDVHDGLAVVELLEATEKSLSSGAPEKVGTSDEVAS